MNKIRNIQFVTSLLVLSAGAGLFLASCKKEDKDTKPSGNMVANKITPDSASGGMVVTLTGSGLADIRSIEFENNKVPASFNPNFNNDQAVIFRVPDTAFGGVQKITFTNSLGTAVSVPFKVIALPNVTAASEYEFSTGSQITLTGNNLESVTLVKLAGTTATATVVSKERKKLVINMPATNLFKAKLEITNASGTIITQQEFVSVDNAFQFFTEDFGATVGGPIQNWSWAGTLVSTDFAKFGAKSLKGTFNSGSWGAVRFHTVDNITYGNYTYFTFWAKGGSADVQLNLTPDFSNTKTVTIQANVWNYFKVPIAGWSNGVTSADMIMQMQGPAGATENIYFDNVLLVK